MESYSHLGSSTSFNNLDSRKNKRGGMGELTAVQTPSCKDIKKELAKPQLGFYTGVMPHSIILFHFT